MHGAGGTLGAMLTGIFANSAINPIFGAGKATGLLEGNAHQLLNQLVGRGDCVGAFDCGNADDPVRGG